jgi:Molecular chaperone GrpE (heat shock protein)
MADEKSPVDEEGIKSDASAEQADAQDEQAPEPESDGAEAGESGQEDRTDADDTASPETQIEELKESVKRAQAELLNVRRRAERDVENAHRYAIEKFVKDLLAVLDSMDRALELARTTEGFDVAMLEGTEMTHKLLLDTAFKHGVEAIDPVGAAFDPQEHQAMSMVPSAEHAPNTVMAVMQKGYKLEGRVIRAAMVVVSQAPTN